MRVLVVDDDDYFAETLAAIALANGRMEVVGRARDGKEALERARALAPELIVMDIQMPLMDGIEATRQLRADGSEAEVVILSGSELEGDIVRAFVAGATGYVHKSRAAEELIPALEAVLAQRERLSRIAARRERHSLRSQPSGRERPT